uniref:Uncharacterized protein n=2 Tax=Macaca TaxID=9539 RepID=A0A5F7ZYX5_MACMU
MHHHTWLIFVFLAEMGFHHVVQANLELPASSDLPASASQSAGITGVNHCTWPALGTFKLCQEPSRRGSTLNRNVEGLTRWGRVEQEGPHHQPSLGREMLSELGRPLSAPPWGPESVRTSKFPGPPCKSPWVIYTETPSPLIW